MQYVISFFFSYFAFHVTFSDVVLILLRICLHILVVLPYEANKLHINVITEVKGWNVEYNR